LDDSYTFDFNPKPDPKCKHCNKVKGKHKAQTLNCPWGSKTRIGYINFEKDKFFEPKKVRTNKND
jgi:hypothetical protein